MPDLHVIGVLFKELAVMGLGKVVADESRRPSLAISIAHFLQRDGETHSKRVAAWTGRSIWVTRIGSARIVFEMNDPIVVWSISHCPDPGF